MIDWKAAMFFGGVALIVCGSLLTIGLVATATSSLIWWAAPAMIVSGAFIAGGSGEM